MVTCSGILVAYFEDDWLIRAVAISLLLILELVLSSIKFPFLVLTVAVATDALDETIVDLVVDAVAVLLMLELMGFLTELVLLVVVLLIVPTDSADDAIFVEVSAGSTVLQLKHVLKQLPDINL